MNKQEIVKRAVDRFLCWKLPEDFAPDGGISFDRSGHKYEPVGTNLLTAEQAKQMFLDCLEGDGAVENTQPGQWAIVEMFGHQRVAGLISEITFGGCNFVRVDVPQVGSTPGFTKMLGQGAIYCINFVSEEIARGSASYNRSVPVQSYEMPQLSHRPDNEEEWS